jgi:hypothetical protein
MIDVDKLAQYWLLVENDCPSLSDKAIQVLLTFVTTYMYKTGFAAVTKTTY